MVLESDNPQYTGDFPSLQTIKDFGEGGGMGDDSKVFTPVSASVLKGLALEKFNLLKTFKDTWSNELYEPRVYSANVAGCPTTWIKVASYHGWQAYVFDSSGQPLASAFMPETGDDFSWDQGFYFDPYNEHTVVEKDSATT